MTSAANELPLASPPESARAESYRRSRVRRKLVSRGLLYVAAVVLALWVLVPLYLITITAFSPRSVVYDYPKHIIPREFSTETMSFFVNSTGVLDALQNSVIVAFTTLLFSSLIGAPAGYA